MRTVNFGHGDIIGKCEVSDEKNTEDIDMPIPNASPEASNFGIIIGIFVGIISTLSAIIVQLIRSAFKDLSTEVHLHQHDQILELDKVYDRIRAGEIKDAKYEEFIEWIKRQHIKNHEELR